MNTKKNIIIVGGGFVNKGGEAMTYVAASQLKLLYPCHNVMLFDYYSGLDTHQKAIYKFEIVNISKMTLFRLTKSIGVVLYLKPYIKDVIKRYILKRVSTQYSSGEEIKNILNNADVIYDISGYGISSHNQTTSVTLFLLMNIKLARLYKLKYIILPQTIGPFEYKGIGRWLLYNLVRKMIKYPEIVFVREESSYSEVSKITPENVKYAQDIVLTSDYLPSDIIHEDKISTFVGVIFKKYVCIIPNIRLTDSSANDDVLYIYKKIIERLLDLNIRVIILRHSNDDIDLVTTLEKLFIKNNCVASINENLYPFELENIISRSDFVITSRYHGLIHSYKHSVPAIAIGWANKYNELMKEFNQSKFCYDINYQIDLTDLLNRVSEIHTESVKISQMLKAKVKTLKNNSIFKILLSQKKI